MYLFFFFFLVASLFLCLHAFSSHFRIVCVYVGRTLKNLHSRLCPEALCLSWRGRNCEAPATCLAAVSPNKRCFCSIGIARLYNLWGHLAVLAGQLGLSFGCRNLFTVLSLCGVKCCPPTRAFSQTTAYLSAADIHERAKKKKKILLFRLRLSPQTATTFFTLCVS